MTQEVTCVMTSSSGVETLKEVSEAFINIYEM